MILKEDTFLKFGYEVSSLSDYSSKKVIVKCDYCNDVVERFYSSYTVQHKKSPRDTCGKRECVSRKLSETSSKKTKNGNRKCSKCNVVKALNGDNFPKCGKRGYRYSCKICTKELYHMNKKLKSKEMILLNEAIIIFEDAVKNDKIHYLLISFYASIT